MNEKLLSEITTESKSITNIILNAKAFRRKRRLHEITLVQVSRLSGVSASFICQIENEKRITGEDTANKLIKALERLVPRE